VPRMSYDPKNTVKNIGLNSVSVLGSYGLQFFTGILLARYLTPSDYGIVGFSLIIINFCKQFADCGVNGALVQNFEANDEFISTGFIIKFVLSALAFILIFVSAPLSQFFIANKELTLVIRILALNLIVSSLGLLPSVKLTRNLNYKMLVIPQVLAVSISSTLAIVMALNGCGYWSLVVSSLASTFVTTFVLNVVGPVRPRFVYVHKHARHILRFGFNLLVPMVITFVAFNADNFAIGAVLGAEQLGYYTIAFNWGSMICMLISGTVHSVLFPTFSKLQNDGSALKLAYLESLSAISFIVIPVSFMLLAMGNEFLFFILGGSTDRWKPALVPFQILCVYGMFRALLEPVSNVITAIGKPELYIRPTLLVAIVELGLLYGALKNFGILGVACIVTFAYVSQYYMYFPILYKEINTSKSDLLRTVLRPAISSVCMLFSIAFIKMCLPFSFLAMFIEAIIGSVIYILCFGVLDRWKMFRKARLILKNAE
jgi:lipopolysaccharide exporter